MDDEEFTSEIADDGVEESMSKAGNELVSGVKSGANSAVNNIKKMNTGLNSTNGAATNKDQFKIPDAKKPAGQNPNGLTGNGIPSGDGLNKDKKDKKNGLDNDKDKNKDKKNGSGLGKDTPENKKNGLGGKESGLGSKDKEKSKSLGDRAKDLFKKKDKDNKLTDGAKKGIKNAWKALPFIAKIKIIGIGILILLIIFIIGLFAAQTSGTFVVLNNITQSFVCTMYEPLPEGSWSVSETYGWHYKENANGEDEEYFNNGIDLSVATGTKVYAVQPGTIIEMSENSEDGKYVIIDHNINDKYSYDTSTYQTKYSHLSSFDEFLEVNSDVVKMTTLGYSDSSGIIHFEVIKDGKNVSINRYFGYSEPTSNCKNRSISEDIPNDVYDDMIDFIDVNECNEMPETIDRDAYLDNCSDFCFNGTFAWPVPGFTHIGSGFGYRIDPIDYTTKFHGGIDINGVNIFGADVIASASGTATTSYGNVGCGTYIVIDHPDGSRTMYCHLSAIVISNGDEVSQGQVIGKIGSTGYSTGPHLHFVIKINGEAVDPTQYVGSGEDSELAMTCESGDSSGLNGGLKVTELINIDDKVLYNQVPTDILSYNDANFISEVLSAYKKMESAALAEGVSLSVNNSFRKPYGHTTSYMSDGTSGPPYDIAGDYMSEHHVGLAIDFSPVSDSFADTAAYTWLIKNSTKYGFFQRYTDANSSITQYIEESWHFRYVGVDVATSYINSGYTSYEEYYCKKLDDTKNTCKKFNWVKVSSGGGGNGSISKD